MTSAVLQENGREVILTLGFAAAAAAEDVRHKVGEKVRAPLQVSTDMRAAGLFSPFASQVAGEAARETVAAPKTPPGR